MPFAFPTNDITALDKVGNKEKIILFNENNTFIHVKIPEESDYFFPMSIKTFFQ